MEYNPEQYFEIESKILELIQDFRNIDDSFRIDDAATYTATIKALKTKILKDRIPSYESNPKYSMSDKEIESLNKMKSRFIKYEKSLSQTKHRMNYSDDYVRMYFWLLHTRNQLDIEYECKMYYQNRRHSS